LFSNGYPFVIKSYKKVGNFETGPITPATYTNAMMEEQSVISFQGAPQMEFDAPLFRQFPGQGPVKVKKYVSDRLH
jgi:hypothetical protein